MSAINSWRVKFLFIRFLCVFCLVDLKVFFENIKLYLELRFFFIFLAKFKNIDMKKMFSILALGLFGVLAFSSCQKCTTCKVMNGDTEITSTGEVCGKQKDIDAAKASMEAANATYKAAGMDYTVVCTDK